MPRFDARRRTRGFTLVELAIVLALVGLLAGLSITNYLGYVEKARVVRAIAEIESLSRVLDGIASDDDASLPDSLAEVEDQIPIDPWGNPYQYLKIQGALPPGVASLGAGLPAVAAPPAGGPGGPGGGGGGGGGGPPAIAKARKDGFLVPINSDYDLYSMGADGDSRPTLNAPVSRDDVIRANNGAYVGLAVLY